jgi:DMSO/TMAO reductase YedYZ heme-binding membrane subunit
MRLMICLFAVPVASSADDTESVQARIAHAMSAGPPEIANSAHIVFFDWNEITKDVLKRPFITASFTALVLLIPLAITSTAGWIRRLGGKRWQMRHQLIYVSVCAGVVHYYWLVKSGIRLPLLYGAIVTVLLAYRLVANLMKGCRPVSPTAACGLVLVA